jgi:hypothetical protein
VTPAYFETMGIRLRDGRTFDASDRMLTPADTGPGVEMSVVVNEALAKKYFPARTRSAGACSAASTCRSASSAWWPTWPRATSPTRRRRRATSSPGRRRGSGPTPRW